MNREQIVSAARQLIGTPYLHQGRVPGHGVDCVGVGVCVAWACGIKQASWNITGYRRIPDGHSLMRHLRENMAGEVDLQGTQPGDLVVIAFDRFPHHVGIAGDYHGGGLSLIHADNRAGRVVEQRLVFNEEIRFVTSFVFPEVA